MIDTLNFNGMSLRSYDYLWTVYYKIKRHWIIICLFDGDGALVYNHYYCIYWITMWVT